MVTLYSWFLSVRVMSLEVNLNVLSSILLQVSSTFEDPLIDAAFLMVSSSVFSVNDTVPLYTSNTGSFLSLRTTVAL